MEELVPAFMETALTPMKSSLTDFAEIGIDAILDDGVLKEVPIIKTLLSVGKVFLSIRDRNFLKQTMVFIQALNSNRLTDEQLQEYKDKLEKNPRLAEKELGRTMVLLDRTIDSSKAKMLAAFFAAYIKQEISWTVFCDLTEVVDRLFIFDVSILYIIESTQITYKTASHVGDRLIAIGLVSNPSRTIELGDLVRPESALPLRLSSLGERFCKYCTKDMIGKDDSE